MADAVSACEATLVGDQLPGDYKWSDGVLAADGNIYGIPFNATQVLRLVAAGSGARNGEIEIVVDFGFLIFIKT